MDYQGFKGKDFEFSPEYMELCAYFAQPEFDSIFKYVGEILKDRPDVTDREQIANAAGEMLFADEAGVKLSASDALRLVDGLTPTPTEELVRILHDAGVTDENFESVVDAALAQEPEDNSGKKLRQDKQTMGIVLGCLAEVVCKNPDVIQTAALDFLTGDSWTQLTLAFLGGELTKDQQEALAKMPNCCDRVIVKHKNNGVMEVIFQIRDIYE